jgi:hypothetical protein
MLGEVGDAGLLFTFVAGAGAREDDKAYRAAVGHTAGDNPQAIVEYILVVHCREFYLALLPAVNQTLAATVAQSLSVEIRPNRWLISKLA